MADAKMIDAELADLKKQAKSVFDSGKIETMIDMYTDDCIILDGGSNKLYRSKEAARPMYMELLKEIKDSNWDHVHRTYLHDAVAEVGTYSCTRKNDEVKEGKYVMLWVKRDGKWKIQYDSYSGM